jgi:hypothetical protein
MRWNHLPVAGGIYAQDPELIRKWNIIFDLRAKRQEEERKREEMKSKRSARVAGRGR